jgi:hypothetical protein
MAMHHSVHLLIAHSALRAAILYIYTGSILRPIEMESLGNQAAIIDRGIR